MAEVIEKPDTHTKPAVEEPKTPVVLGEGEVAIKKADLDDLTSRAEVSSQNFERLKKEQERREELEAELQTLKADNNVPSGFEDERVGAIQAELADIKAKQAKTEVIEQFPVLKEVWSDFEAFRADPENKGMGIKAAAKAFMAEKELKNTPRRDGLENPTGGDRTPVASGMTPDEAKKLRETDYKKYSEMVRKGQIKVA